MKKSPEQKLVDQIDRLNIKQRKDTVLMSDLVKSAAAISQKTDTETRKQHDEIKELIATISDSFDRRKRLLKRKWEKLSELRTMILVSESLS